MEINTISKKTFNSDSRGFLTYVFLNSMKCLPEECQTCFKKCNLNWTPLLQYTTRTQRTQQVPQCGHSFHGESRFFRMIPVWPKRFLGVDQFPNKIDVFLRNFELLQSIFFHTVILGLFRSFFAILTMVSTCSSASTAAIATTTATSTGWLYWFM